MKILFENKLLYFISLLKLRQSARTVTSVSVRLLYHGFFINKFRKKGVDAR